MSCPSQLGGCSQLRVSDYPTALLTKIGPKVCGHYILCVFCSVGSGGDIQLNGEFILEEHCSFVNEKGWYTCRSREYPVVHALLHVCCRVHSTRPLGLEALRVTGFDSWTDPFLFPTHSSIPTINLPYFKTVFPPQKQLVST